MTERDSGSGALTAIALHRDARCFMASEQLAGLQYSASSHIRYAIRNEGVANWVILSSDDNPCNKQESATTNRASLTRPVDSVPGVHS